MCQACQVRQSAIPRPAAGFFSVHPWVFLGTEERVARLAMAYNHGPGTAAQGYVWIVNGAAVRAAVGEALEAVLHIAGQVASETHNEVLVGQAIAIHGDRVLYRALERLEPATQEKLLAEAMSCTEALLAKAGKTLPILDPGNPQDRNMIVQETADAMVSMARPWEIRATTAARKFLDANWPELSARQRKELIEAAANRMMIVPVKATKGVNGVVSVTGDKVLKGARAGAIQQHKLNIGVNLSAQDYKTVEFMRGTTYKWLTNEYGRRRQDYEGYASATVEQGLKQGLGRLEISKQLTDQYGASIGGRTQSYFTVYAGALVDRSRSRAEMNAYREAYITRWIASAVMDEATTDFCRWVDGKVFEVEESINVMDRGEDPNLSVEDLKLANPWARQFGPGGSMVGVRTPYGPGDARMTALFEIDKSGMGTQGKGQYTDKGGANNLTALGVGPPPYHGNCRTTTYADVETISFPVQAPDLPEPETKPGREPGPDDYLADDKAVASQSGASLPFDEDQIENMDVRVRRLQDADGDVVHDFSFKVTEQNREAVSKALRVMGSKAEDHYYIEKDVLPSGMLKETGGRHSFDILSYQLQRPATKIMPAHTVGISTKGALKNQIDIRVKTGDHKKAFATYRKLCEEMGIKRGANPPDPKALEKLFQAKAVTQWSPRRYGADLARGEIEAEKAFDYLAQDMPELKEVVAKAELREVVPGHRAGYSTAQAQMFDKAGRDLYHDTQAGPVHMADLMARGDQGALLSSTSRYDRGVFVNGMSTSEDFRTGGADGVFTRMARSAREATEKGGNFRLVIDRKELGRMDWWAYDGDRYGTTDIDKMTGRMSVPNLLKEAPDSCTNEFMFQKGVSMTKVKRIVTRGSETRQSLLAELKKRGIAKYNGVPVEKFVIVGK
jgi:hypothetical protein